jgi:transcriptional regulator with XRE-family HTH domain
MPRLDSDGIAEIRHWYATLRVLPKEIAARKQLHIRTVYRYLKGLTQEHMRSRPQEPLIEAKPKRKAYKYLTAQQLAALPELCLVHTQKQIAEKFGVAHTTVMNARKKLGVRLSYDTRVRLDEATARAILVATGKHLAIASRFSTSAATVSSIKRGMTWKTLK